MSEFRNPQHEPGTERRLLLVFALTFLILMAAQPLLFKYSNKGAPEQTQQKTAPAQPQQTPAATAVPPAPAAEVAKEVAAQESQFTVENDLYRITFTNKGGLVKSWILKKYRDDKGQPLELVNSFGAEKYGYPLSLWTYDEGLRNKLNTALYVTASEGTARAPAEVSFHFSDGTTVARKTFRFDHSYVVQVETAVTEKGQRVQAYPAWPSGFGDQTTPASYAATSIDLEVADKVQRTSPDKVSGGATLRGPFVWGGVVGQYFGAAFIPADPSNAALVTLHNQIEIPNDLNKPDPNEVTRVSVLGLAAGGVNGVTAGKLFVGPKDVDVLHSVKIEGGHDLGGMVDFGFFGVIAKPLFLWLKWTYKYVPNWGWSIVILTVIINLALLPLRVSSMKSSLKMQKIQPQMNAIKAKYSKYKMNDPRRQEQNKEIQALFAEHKVNPAGGCLPLLIQMPFLFAFYKMLTVAIELRQAPWLWIKDLSAPDPWHVMPVLIVLSTLWMQKMTPMPGMDPRQARMMTLMMPVMLGLFSWSVAAGLGLYWFLGTVIAIIQQAVMNRTQLGREMRAELEKRARKKALKTTSH